MTPSAQQLSDKLADRGRMWLAGRRFAARTELVPRQDLVMLGTVYGAWWIPARLLDADSVCYLAGIGTDASFDLAVVDRYGCPVYAFDPTPASATFVEQTIHDPRYHFMPVGISDRDETETFYAPDTETGVSLRSFGETVLGELPVRSLSSLMAELGHDRIDLLKLCVEGFEHRILATLLGSPLRPSVICVEFARNNLRPDQSYRRLVDAGYRMVHSRLPLNSDWKFTFVHSDVPDTGPAG